MCVAANARRRYDRRDTTRPKRNERTIRTNTRRLGRRARTRRCSANQCRTTSPSFVVIHNHHARAAPSMRSFVRRSSSVATVLTKTSLQYARDRPHHTRDTSHTHTPPYTIYDPYTTYTQNPTPTPCVRIYPSTDYTTTRQARAVSRAFSRRYRRFGRFRSFSVAAMEGTAARGRDWSIARFPAKTARANERTNGRPDGTTTATSTTFRTTRDGWCDGCDRRRRRTATRAGVGCVCFFVCASVPVWFARARVDARRVAGARRRRRRRRR